MNYLVIIDDSTTIQKQITYFCKEIFPDLTVKAYNSGEEALQELPKFASSIKIAIIDYNMNGMNGIDLILKLEGILNYQKIILCTANIQESIQIKANKINIEFAEKPLTKDKFKEIVLNKIQG